MATHSSVLAWRIPGTGEPGGLPSMGSHRVGHNWSDLAVAVALVVNSFRFFSFFSVLLFLFLNNPLVLKRDFLLLGTQVYADNYSFLSPATTSVSWLLFLYNFTTNSLFIVGNLHTLYLLLAPISHFLFCLCCFAGCPGYVWV